MLLSAAKRVRAAAAWQPNRRVAAVMAAAVAAATATLNDLKIQQDKKVQSITLLTYFSFQLVCLGSLPPLAVLVGVDPFLRRLYSGLRFNSLLYASV